MHVYVCLGASLDCNNGTWVSSGSYFTCIPAREVAEITGDSNSNNSNKGSSNKDDKSGHSHLLICHLVLEGLELAFMLAPHLSLLRAQLTSDLLLLFPLTLYTISPDYDAVSVRHHI